jgi:hypothetical protein
LKEKLQKKVLQHLYIFVEEDISKEFLRHLYIFAEEDTSKEFLRHLYIFAEEDTSKEFLRHLYIFVEEDTSKEFLRHKTVGWGDPVIFPFLGHLHMANQTIPVPFRYSETSSFFSFDKHFLKTKTHQAKQRTLQPSMTADAAIRIDLTLRSLHTFPTRSATLSYGHHPYISTMP